MKEEIFRKKSLDRIKSPEALNDYVRVANPGVWLLLAAVIALLLGAIAWGVFGRIETMAAAIVRVENGEAFCCVEADEADRIEAGMTVKLDGAQGVIVEIVREGEKSLMCPMTLDPALEDGLYAAQVVTESVKPMSFVLN